MQRTLRRRQGGASWCSATSVEEMEETEEMEQMEEMGEMEEMETEMASKTETRPRSLQVKTSIEAATIFLKSHPTR